MMDQRRGGGSGRVFKDGGNVCSSHFGLTKRTDGTKGGGKAAGKKTGTGQGGCFL